MWYNSRSMSLLCLHGNSCLAKAANQSQSLIVADKSADVDFFYFDEIGHFPMTEYRQYRPILSFVCHLLKTFC